ncbi:MAG: beta-lactamase family protein, partial [Cytophagales bacterium]|nr:beta-lactamase family protein [Cytophaga sp.]
SKWISAAVMLSLADQQLLSLDDSIGKYLPLFSRHGTGSATIRQCLTHTSGFPAFARNIGMNDTTLAQLVDHMAEKVAFINHPGERFVYGEMSYRIAGRIAEVVTGKTWEALFQTNIASKCTMTNSTYCWEKRIPAVGGGICTTPADYLNFLHMLMNKGACNGQVVLSEASVMEFFTNQLTAEAQKEMVRSESLIKEVSDGKPISYGLGVWIYDYKADQQYQTLVFCPGALGTFPFVDRCRNIYGIILCNTNISKVIQTEVKAIDLVKKSINKECN